MDRLIRDSSPSSEYKGSSLLVPHNRRRMGMTFFIWVDIFDFWTDLITTDNRLDTCDF